MQVTIAVVSGFGDTFQVDIVGATMVAPKAVTAQVALVGRSVAEGLQQGDHVDGVAVVVVETFLCANFRRRRRTRLVRVEILVGECEPMAGEPVVRAAVFLAFVDHVHPRLPLPRSYRHISLIHGGRVFSASQLCPRTQVEAIVGRKERARLGRIKRRLIRGAALSI